MIATYTALLFDLDGTLVDSSEVVRNIMAAWCLEHDIPLQAVLSICHGARTEDTVAAVAPHLCARSEALRLEHLESTTLEGLMPVSGANRFLSSLEFGLWGVVTSSSMLTAKPKLASCRFPIPEVLITAESVAYGKPHPEPFLKAAKEFGKVAEDCLVFEDADHGVNAALAAGCKVIVVGNSCQIEHPRIVHRIESFDEIASTHEGDLQIGGKTIAVRKRWLPNAALSK